MVHSGYRRNIETTEGLLSAYPDEERARMTVRHHLFIRERDGGHTYDMTDAQASAAFPWLQDYWNPSARSSRGRPTMPRAQDDDPIV